MRGYHREAHDYNERIEDKEKKTMMGGRIWKHEIHTGFAWACAAYTKSKEPNVKGDTVPMNLEYDTNT